jgi:hypothetical protein
MWAGLLPPKQYVPIEARYIPGMMNHELSLRLFDVYQEVYQGVAAQFPEICEIQAASIQPSGEPHWIGDSLHHSSPG